MKFKKGQVIRPRTVNEIGSVIFENSSSDICNPNKGSCEAYGYRWDPVNNTCQAYPIASNAVIQKLNLLVGNKTNGPRNEVKAGSYYNDINGADNLIGRNVQNSDINGKGNEVEDNIINASVSGSYAKVQRQGEIALGGGNYSQADNINGRAQSSTIHAITRTSGPGTFIAKISDLGNAIAVQTHSVIIFDLTGTVIKEAGGSNWSFNRRIIATIGNSKEATFCNVSSSIDCGPAPEGWTYPEFLQLTGGEEYDYGNLQLNVVGIPEVDLMYNIKIDLIETRTINNF